MSWLRKCLLLVGLLSSMWACEGQKSRTPEPHLELGQRISFVGGTPDKTYVIIGYRHFLEDKTDKAWQDQPYIVVTYTTSQEEIKVATIHRNAILKR